MKKVGWGLMFFLALLMFFLAGRYLTLNPEVYFPEQKAVYIAYTTGLLIHIIGAMLTIIIGPLQFLPRIITKKYIHFHRWLGRIYLGGVVFGSLGGFYMALMAYGGLPAEMGFALLSILWLSTGIMAYIRIREKNVIVHRQWMIRNYALTFAAVTLRLWQVFFGGFEIDFTESYLTVAWLCWVPNLILAEIVVNQTRSRHEIPVVA